MLNAPFSLAGLLGALFAARQPRMPVAQAWPCPVAQHTNPALNAKRKIKRAIGSRQERRKYRHCYWLKAVAKLDAAALQSLRPTA